MLVHVECGFVGGQAENWGSAQTILQKPEWSETFSTPGATVKAAGHGGGKDGEPVFTIFAQSHVFVSIGPDPDAANGPRRLIKAWDQVSIFAAKGDRLAWTSASDLL